MRIKLLIATGDYDYSEHLSGMLSEHHADVFDVSVCRTPEHLHELLASAKFGVALLEPSWAEIVDLDAIRLPMLLWSEDGNEAGTPSQIIRLCKYQRASSIVADILEYYAKVSPDKDGSDPAKAYVTAVWSPAGGVGKTTVALAYAAKKASDGKQVLYLNFEPFSSIPMYFPEAGKSVSAIFEMLDSGDGNIKTLIRGIQKQDSETGLAYFCCPDNYDDMNVLSAQNISALINACAGVADELVIDMSCDCDERTRQTFEFSDRVFLVTDTTNTAHTKLFQFSSQNNVFTRIREKATLVANKGATECGSFSDSVIRLPNIQSQNASVIFKTLSGNSFEVQVNRQ